MTFFVVDFIITQTLVADMVCLVGELVLNLVELVVHQLLL